LKPREIRGLRGDGLDRWRQVKDQGSAYQNESDPRRDECRQHGGRKDREDDE
jgi:hypothetical protein